MQKQIANTSKEEPFDLSVWIVNKLGLNTARQDHKQRLEELVEVFDRAGYRKYDAFQMLDDDELAAIDSKLENKLEQGEKKLFKMH